MTPSLYELIAETGLTYREALAVRVLYKDGWTVGELAMTFQLGEDAIRRALTDLTRPESTRIAAEVADG